MSGSWQRAAAATEIHLLVPLTKERDNIFAAGAEAARFVEALHLPGKAKCELGRLQLAVENPERYRTNLLGQIAQEIKKTREAMATQGSVKVEGLESSVLVRQADDRQVELFLNYSLSIGDEAKPALHLYAYGKQPIFRGIVNRFSRERRNLVSRSTSDLGRGNAIAPSFPVKCPISPEIKPTRLLTAGLFVNVGVGSARRE